MNHTPWYIATVVAVYLTFNFFVVVFAAIGSFIMAVHPGWLAPDPDPHWREHDI